MSVYDSAKEEQPEWCVVLHARSRWFVCAERYQPRSAVYEIDQTHVATIHIRAEEVRESEISHRRYTVEPQ